MLSAVLVGYFIARLSLPSDTLGIKVLRVYGYAWLVMITIPAIASISAVLYASFSDRQNDVWKDPIAYILLSIIVAVFVLGPGIAALYWARRQRRPGSSPNTFGIKIPRAVGYAWLAMISVPAIIIIIATWETAFSYIPYQAWNDPRTGILISLVVMAVVLGPAVAVLFVARRLRPRNAVETGDRDT